MLLPAAAICALVLASPVLAAPSFEVELQPGVDPARAQSVVTSMLAIKRRFPALVAPSNPRKLVMLSPGTAVDFVATYCFADVTLNAVPLCRKPENAASILIDLDGLDKLLARIPDFFKEGLGAEGILFHEMLHGWGDRHPGIEAEYQEKASHGRLTDFDREAAPFYKKLGKLEDALNKYRAQESGKDDPRSKEIIRRYEGRIEEARLGANKPRAKLAHRLRLPQHHPEDAHAAENRAEWFAYGGEIHFYAAEPDALLTPDERAWWRKSEAGLQAAPGTGLMSLAP